MSDMSDRIEQIARATMIAGNSEWFSEEHIDSVLAKTTHDADCDDGEYCDFCWANREREIARAAYLATLRSIREPGEGALKAGGTHQGWPDITDGKIILRLEDIKMDYQAIIDHLIAEAIK